MYRALDPTKIIATIDLLRNRIDARFPGAGLAGVAQDLALAARATQRNAEALARPSWWSRLLPVLFVVLLLCSVFYLPRALKIQVTNTEATNLLQTFEAVLNVAVFGGVAMIFLAGLQRRLNRRRALRALHQLRSLVHVIDMHQLTKDPSLVLGKEHNTVASPKRHMTDFELGRYLDYCSEMLALTGKVAALYAQGLDDAVVIGAVNDIEMLATNLSRKIWQKIAILQRAVQAEQRAAGAE